jgi:hypothetical protein
MTHYLPMNHRMSIAHMLNMPEAADVAPKRRKMGLNPSDDLA